MKAGIAKMDITPPIGVELAGLSCREKPSQGIADRLYARALVLDDGIERVALITNDLLAVDWSLVGEVRHGIAKEHRMKAENVAIVATHSHSGPAAFDLYGCGEVDRKWLTELKEKMVRVVGQAAEDLQEARIGGGKGMLAEICVNRRKVGDDGVARLCHNPDGIVDPEVGVIRIDGGDGKPMAVVCNFSCHPLVGLGNECLYRISASFPGCAMRVLERNNIAGFYTTGADGDVNSTVFGGTFEDAQEMGVKFATEVLRVLNTIKTEPDGRIRVISRIVELPFENVPSVKEVEALSREYADKYRQQRAGKSSGAELNEALALDKWAKTTLRLLQQGKKSKAVKAELQVFKFGNVALVMVPAELFVELGLGIKRASAFENTFIVGYANGMVGYVPTAQAHAEGGYEVEKAYRLFGQLSRFRADAGNILRDAAIEMLRR